MAEKTEKQPTSAANGIPDDLKRKAESKGWPLQLVERALAAGMKEEFIHQALDAGMTATQAKATWAW